MQSYGNYPYYGQPVYPALANLNISGGTFNDVGRDLFADNTIVFNNNRGVAGDCVNGAVPGSNLTISEQHLIFFVLMLLSVRHITQLTVLMLQNVTRGHVQPS